MTATSISHNHSETPHGTPEFMVQTMMNCPSCGPLLARITAHVARQDGATDAADRLDREATLVEMLVGANN